MSNSEHKTQCLLSYCTVTYISYTSLFCTRFIVIQPGPKRRHLNKALEWKTITKDTGGVLNFEIIRPSKGLYLHVAPRIPTPMVFYKFKVQNGNIFWGMLKFQIFLGYACLCLIICWVSIARKSNTNPPLGYLAH